MTSRHQTQTLMSRAKRSLAGGVSSDVRLGEKPFPMCYSRGEGSRIYDVDGNAYVDYVLGMGPLILGHSPRSVLDAVQTQMGKGIIYAGQHELEIELSERLQQFIPCAELTRFNSTGSEAVHAALRLARAYTGRSKIIRFEGHYHGWFDNILIDGISTTSADGRRQAPAPALRSAGQSESVLQDVIVLPWNDLSILARTIASHGDEVAGVITEPMMLNSGGIPPREGYLEGLRDVCSQNGIVLIFDEVITGFRLSLAGAQGLYGVTPDIAVFAKAMASGFPLSAVVGRREIMSMISRGEVMHAGTYNSNPVVVAAALATLDELAGEDGAVYRQMTEVREHLEQGIVQLLIAKGIPAQVIGAGTMFYVTFTSLPAFRDYRESLNQDVAAYDRFLRALADRGVRTTSRGIWFLSGAHTIEDAEFTLNAVEEALSAM